MLKTRREKLGWSMQRLAVESNCRKITIMRIENGTIRNASVDMIRRICEAVGLSVGEVLS